MERPPSSSWHCRGLHPASPALGFFRDCARLCVISDLEERGPRSLSRFHRACSTGLPARRRRCPEANISAARLQMWWADLQAFFPEEIRRHRGSVQSYLQAKNSVWNLVGRVYFHLAENKAAPDHPCVQVPVLGGHLLEGSGPRRRPSSRAGAEKSAGCLRGQAHGNGASSRAHCPTQPIGGQEPGARTRSKGAYEHRPIVLRG